VLFPFGRKKSSTPQQEQPKGPRRPVFTEQLRAPLWRSALPMARTVLASPEAFWREFAKGKGQRVSREMLYDYALPLSVAGTLFWLVGTLLFENLSGYWILTLPRDTLYRCSISVVGVFLGGMLLKKVVQRRLGEDLPLDATVAVVTYSATPWLLFRCAPWMPGVGDLFLGVSLFGIYLLFTAFLEVFPTWRKQEVVLFTSILSGYFLIFSYIFN
jgi:hypothetical protein